MLKISTNFLDFFKITAFELVEKQEAKYNWRFSRLKWNKPWTRDFFKG